MELGTGDLVTVSTYLMPPDHVQDATVYAGGYSVWRPTLPCSLTTEYSIDPCARRGTQARACWWSGT
jgi:hypothetical protein